MFIIDDIIGGLMNMGNTALSSQLSLQNQQELMKSQDYYQRKFLRDSFGITREGLTRAGYNPLLALGNMNSAGSVATGGNIAMDTSNPFAASTNANAARRQSETSEKMSNSQIDVNSALAAKTYAEANRFRVLTDMEKKVMQEKINNLKANSSWHNRYTFKHGFEGGIEIPTKFGTIRLGGSASKYD